VTQSERLATHYLQTPGMLRWTLGNKSQCVCRL